MMSLNAIPVSFVEASNVAIPFQKKINEKIKPMKLYKARMNITKN